MKENSVAACFLPEQMIHDAMAILGMNPNEEFDRGLDELEVIVIANRTERHLVVPRNCYYCISGWNVLNYVVPISPRSAFLFFPKEHLNLLNLQDNDYAVIDDTEQIEQMNVYALKYEYMFNAEFVASDCRLELERLQEFRNQHLDKLNSLKTRDISLLKENTNEVC